MRIRFVPPMGEVTGCLVESISGVMRRAADDMTTTGEDFHQAVGLVLFHAAERYDQMLVDTTRHSPGYDQPPAVFWDDPDGAVDHADTMFRREIAAARAWNETR